MSLVVVPKFNFIEMLNGIVRHRISHLMRVCFQWSYKYLLNDIYQSSRLVPPQVVLICKVLNAAVFLDCLC